MREAPFGHVLLPVELVVGYNVPLEVTSRFIAGNYFGFHRCIHPNWQGVGSPNTWVGDSHAEVAPVSQFHGYQVVVLPNKGRYIIHVVVNPFGNQRPWAPAHRPQPVDR